MLFNYLLLAHLIGDFVLQPSKLVKWKINSKIGMLVHVGVHFILYVLILLPFLALNPLYLILIPTIICLTHFIIDESKISYDLKHDKKVIPFLADQLLHVIVLIIVSQNFDFLNLYTADTKFYEIYLNQGVIVFLLLLIFVSEIVEIYLFQEEREESTKAVLKRNKKAKFKRIAMLSTIYLIFLLLLKSFN